MSTLSGVYYDPKHGGCLRTVRRLRDGRYIIRGVYGNDEAPYTHRPWFAYISFVGASTTELTVDFVGKIKRQRFLRARVDGRRILWGDGNVWTRMYVHAGTQMPCQMRHRR